MSIDRGMDQKDVVHIYNGILLSHKLNKNNVICSNVDEPKMFPCGLVLRNWCFHAVALVKELES